MLEKILIGIVGALVVSVLTYFFKKWKDNEILIAVFQFILVIVLSAFLIAYYGHEQPRLSLLQSSVQVDYSNKVGLPVDGDFNGIDNKSIYLLARKINPDSEVWTVVQQVSDIDKDRHIWKGRLSLSRVQGHVSTEDMYAIVGVLTDRVLTVGATIDTPNLRLIATVLTQVLEVTVKEVTDG